MDIQHEGSRFPHPWERRMLRVGASLMILTLVGCTNGEDSDTNTDTDTDSDTDLSTVYKLGGMGSITGFGESGSNLRKILEYEIGNLNASLAEDGIEIDFDFRDSGCDGATAAATFRGLKADGYDIIIGPGCSGASAGTILPPEGDNPSVGVWADRDEWEAAWQSSVVVSPGSASYTLVETATALTVSPLPYHSASWSSASTGQPTGKVLCAAGSKVALLTEDDVFTNSVTSGAKIEMESSCSGTLVDDDVITMEQAAVETSLRAFRTAGADAVLLNPHNAEAAETMIDALALVFAEDTSWSPQLVGTFPFADPAVIAAGEEELEGMIVVGTVDPPRSQNGYQAYFDDMVAEIGTAVEDYETAWGGVYFSMVAVDTIRILVDLSVEHESDPAAIRQALTTTTFDGFVGTLRWDDEVFVHHADGSPIIAAATRTIADGNLGDPVAVE